MYTKVVRVVHQSLLKAKPINLIVRVITLIRFGIKMDPPFFPWKENYIDYIRLVQNMCIYSNLWKEYTLLGYKLCKYHNDMPDPPPK